MNITLTQKNVHSKALFKTIDSHINAICLLLDLSSDTDTIVQLIEMLLHDEAENYKLEQINVISDVRNNKFSDSKKGKNIIDIYFRQKNCFNTTHLSYMLQK